MIVIKQVKSSRKDVISQRFVFKTKGLYRVLEKTTPSSFWIQIFPLCEGIGRIGIKVKESAASMENIPNTIVLHKHVDGEDTRFDTMVGPSETIFFEKWLGVIKRGTYKAASEYSRWANESVSGLCRYIKPDRDSSDDGASDEEIKDQ